MAAWRAGLKPSEEISMPQVILKRFETPDEVISFEKEYNKRCGPFEWTKGPEKLRRIIQLTEQWQANMYATDL
jgi:hypothetical protein